MTVPLGQYEPVGHITLVAGVVQYLPAGHVEQDGEPAWLYWPALHGRHAESVVDFVFGLYVPAGHGVGVQVPNWQ